MGRTRGGGVAIHTHQYHKIDEIWYCAFCTHYLPLNHRGGNPIGLPSKCWECREKFILDEKTTENDKPICHECIMKNEGINVDELKEFIKSKEVFDSLAPFKQFSRDEDKKNENE